jgi:hypothetical protein
VYIPGNTGSPPVSNASLGAKGDRDMSETAIVSPLVESPENVDEDSDSTTSETLDESMQRAEEALVRYFSGALQEQERQRERRNGC